MVEARSSHDPAAFLKGYGKDLGGKSVELTKFVKGDVSHIDAAEKRIEGSSRDDLSFLELAFKW